MEFSEDTALLLTDDPHLQSDLDKIRIIFQGKVAETSLKQLLQNEIKWYRKRQHWALHPQIGEVVNNLYTPGSEALFELKVKNMVAGLDLKDQTYVRKYLENKRGSP